MNERVNWLVGRWMDEGIKESQVPSKEWISVIYYNGQI